MRKIQFLTLLAFLFVAMNGCKYEEGPFISFIPKVERVANTWKVSSATLNGNPESNVESIKTVTFYKEGNASVTFDIANVDVVFNGNWTFNAKKETILLTTEDGSGFLNYDRTMTILKLKEEELHVSWIDGTDAYDVVFTPANPS